MSWYTGNAEELAQLSQWKPSSTLTAIFIALSIVILSSFFWSSSSSNDKIHELDGFHLLTAWSFFSNRYDFFREHFKKTGLEMFCFHILHVGSYICVQYAKIQV